MAQLSSRDPAHIANVVDGNHHIGYAPEQDLITSKAGMGPGATGIDFPAAGTTTGQRFKSAHAGTLGLNPCDGYPSSSAAPCCTSTRPCVDASAAKATLSTGLRVPRFKTEHHFGGAGGVQMAGGPMGGPMGIHPMMGPAAGGMTNAGIMAAGAGPFGGASPLHGDYGAVIHRNKEKDGPYPGGPSKFAPMPYPIKEADKKYWLEKSQSISPFGVGPSLITGKFEKDPLGTGGRLKPIQYPGMGPNPDPPKN